METSKYSCLNNKSVFISGGATGIGASFVRAFASQGAAITFIDIAEADGLALQAEIRSTFGTAISFRVCDVRNINALRLAVLAAANDHGKLAVLVNNAADDTRHALEDITVEYWNERLAINLTHIIFASKEAANQMKEAGGGSIINLGSICCKLPNAGMIGYSVAKAAVHGATRCLAKELGAHSIRVNTLSPGWVMTEKQLALYAGPGADQLINQMQSLPSKVTPGDIAAAGLFLASDASRLCTAQELIIDGGWV